MALQKYPRISFTMVDSQDCSLLALTHMLTCSTPNIKLCCQYLLPQDDLLLPDFPMPKIGYSRLEVIEE